MYAAIAKTMVRSSRIRNFPAHIPASQSQTLPPQRREPASASVPQIDILYLSFILSDFFLFYPGLRDRRNKNEFNSGLQPSEQGPDVDTPPLRDGAEIIWAFSPFG